MTYGAVNCHTCVRGECVVVHSVNGLYRIVHHSTLMHVDLSPYRTSTWGMRRRTAPYARLMQATQGPKHASNLMHVISHDKFQPCHWPFLEYFAFIALHALRCVLLEIALNAGSVVLEGAARPVRSAWIHYGSFIRRSTCRSYRIVSYRDILSDIVSYPSFSLMAVSCHYYTCCSYFRNITISHNKTSKFV